MTEKEKTTAIESARILSTQITAEPICALSNGDMVIYGHESNIQRNKLRLDSKGFKIIAKFKNGQKI